MQIKEGDTGYSYSSLFKSYLDANMSRVDVLDPYVRSKHQVRTYIQYIRTYVHTVHTVHIIVQHIRTCAGLHTGFGARGGGGAN